MTDAVDRLLPGLRAGERVTLLAATDAGPAEVLGFVTAVDAETLAVLDRRGTSHRVPRAAVRAAKRLGVARGRDPLATPRRLLDDLAARAGASGTPYVARISDLLAGLEPPAAVPPWGPVAEFAGVVARCEGEWVTLTDAGPDAARQAAWWATRMGARSVQVRTDDPAVAAELTAAGFRPLS
nr:hypothetical protein [Propionibacterium sp.]